MSDYKEEILAQRICERLGGLSSEMAQERAGWPTEMHDLIPYFNALSSDSFKVVLDLREDKVVSRELLKQIEENVNGNTNSFTRQVHGEFEFGDDFLDTLDAPALLATFNAATCSGLKERLAAHRTVQRLFGNHEGALRGCEVYKHEGAAGDVIMYRDIPGLEMTMNNLLQWKPHSPK